MLNIKFPPNQKQLFSKLSSKGGRNRRGLITVRARSTRKHRLRYRLIDFGRFLWNTPGIILSINYNTLSNCFLGLVAYSNKAFSYIILPENLFPGDVIVSGKNVDIKIGNSLLLENIPLNIPIHNVEIYPFSGGKLLRSAGCFGVIIRKTKTHAFIKIKNKNFLFKLSLQCSATIGRVSNKFFKYRKFRKAGQLRNIGFKSTVRGVAKNPVDHPHGGGEGKKSPKSISMSPWKKLGKNQKTVKKKCEI